MEIKFLSVLKDPYNKKDLIWHCFEQNEGNLLNGIFINEESKKAYPLENGVPVFTSAPFSENFISKFKSEIEKIESNLSFKLSIEISKDNWSFSNEWEYHFENDLKTTWGWTVEQRFQQLLAETQLINKKVDEHIVLDAGCGNGMLTERVSLDFNLTFGVDFSNSVFFSEKNRQSKNVCFIKADLRYLPFSNDFFDVVFSNGVIHHTDNTKKTFDLITPTIKKGGVFYIWLYSRKGRFLWRFKRRIYDFIRLIVCRFPNKAQKITVNFFSRILSLFVKNKSLDEIKIDMFDSITPRWRFYHTPEEVSFWYYHAGFGPVTLTHFDNVYGFGVMAVKDKQNQTPGENFK